jgi:tetratricopeptide (TPR) repeat protein
MSQPGQDGWDAAQEGAELLAEGQAEEAVRLLHALIERQPSNEYAYFFLGAALYELERHEKALAAYVKALDLAPGYLGAMVGAGHSLRALGRYEQAIRMGQEVLKRAREDGDALFLLGSAHFGRGDDAAAIQYLNRFMETRPEAEVAAEARGMLQVLQGEIVPALPVDDPD